jgi:nucleoside-diphosphate-sugar epimerase
MTRSAYNIVLGGDGLIGRCLTEALQRRGEDVHSYDLAGGFDLRRRLPLLPAGRDVFVWFLAWDVGGSKYIHNPTVQRRCYTHNIELCNNVFPWLEKHGLPFIFTGSQLAGTETAYGRSKAVGASRTRALGGQLAILWNVYGPEAVSLRSHIIPDLIAQGWQKAIHLRSDGCETRRFLHVRDCVQALLQMRHTGQAEAHICGDQTIEIRALAKMVAGMMGARVILGTARGSQIDVHPTLLLDGWKPTISLRQGVHMVLQDISTQSVVVPHEGHQ